MGRRAFSFLGLFVGDEGRVEAEDVLATRPDSWRPHPISGIGALLTCSGESPVFLCILDRKPVTASQASWERVGTLGSGVDFTLCRSIAVTVLSKQESVST